MLQSPLLFLCSSASLLRRGWCLFRRAICGLFPYALFRLYHGSSVSGVASPVFFRRYGVSLSYLCLFVLFDHLQYQADLRAREWQDVAVAPTRRILDFFAGGCIVCFIEGGSEWRSHKSEECETGVLRTDLCASRSVRVRDWAGSLVV